MAAPPDRVPNPAALRVGVLGCGFFAVNQVRVVIASLCDCRVDRANRLAKAVRLDVPTNQYAAEMVDKVALDFLDIITAPATHPELVARAANRKLPAIVQKPVEAAYDSAGSGTAVRPELNTFTFSSS
jgi:predicted dehydrogenase